ncbi:MAG: WD40 repeat domain-containing protein [Chloroflexota bacterium]
MYKKLLSVMVYGLLFAACGGQAVSIPTVTPIPPTIIPSPISLSATLLVEKNLETETGTSYSLDWSPDGEMLVVASGVEITLLSGDLGKIISNLKPSSGALTATWSPDQKSFATVVGFRNPKIMLWDRANNQLTLAQEISAGSDQYSASWSPDGKLLATLANDRKSIIQIWDTGTWKLLHKFDLPYANPRRALDWSADSKTIYDAGELEGSAVYFALNVEDGSVQELGKLPVEQAYAFSISPDSKRIAVADEAGMVRIFEVGSDDLLIEFQAVDNPADLAWHPNDSTLAILGYKATLQLWSLTP